MSERPIIHGTLDQVPHVSQKLRLRCRQCGARGVYDVGTVLCDTEGEGDSATTCSTFTNYFRCKKCHSGGPWEIEDSLKMLGLALRAKVDRNFRGLHAGRCALFDGTFIQTPALGEDHLLKLIKASPRNAFLHTRLGNLFRSCGQESKAAEWYEKALGLDAGDVEARYHLFCFALRAEDLPSVLTHAPLLVRYLLEGRRTDQDDLTEGMAYSVVENLHAAPEPFRQHFLGPEKERSQPKEVVFIRTLLMQEGDEEDILRDAAERLLRGRPAPAAAPSVSPQAAPLDLESGALALIPSLAEVVRVAGLNPERLRVTFETDLKKLIRLVDKHSLRVSDGAKMAAWDVPSLRELFRGNRPPPPEMDHYPESYTPLFFFVESQVLTLCDAMGDRTDQELEEIYAALRRRPDGRSLGVVHDFLWQVAALLLGCYVVSEAEFEALIGALLHSTRQWALRPISRNYVDYLRQSFGDAHTTRLLPRRPGTGEG